MRQIKPDRAVSSAIDLVKAFFPVRAKEEASAIIEVLTAIKKLSGGYNLELSQKTIDILEGSEEEE